MAAPTYATITGRITQPGTDVGIRAKVTATPQTTNAALTFSGNRNTWGPQTAETDSGGNLAALKIPLNPDQAGVLWKFTAEPLDRIPGLGGWVLGIKSVTGDARLEQLVDVITTAVTPSTIESVSTYAADAQTAATNAQAAATAAQAVGTTNDTVIAGRVNDTASATRAALNGSFTSVINLAGKSPAANGTTDDSAKIQQAVNAAAAFSTGATIFIPKGVYGISTPIALPTSVPVRLVGEPGATLKALAPMTAMITKTSGAGVGGGIVDLDLDANQQADRCIDIEAGLRFKISGGVWQNAKVCVADFGRQGGQVYEMIWRDTRVVGTTGVLSTMPTYGARLGAQCTDSVIDNVVVKSADKLVEDNGSINVWQNVHVFSVAGLPASVGFRVPGSLNRFVSCYADTQLVGFDLIGLRNSVINAMFFWLSGITMSGTVIGVRVADGANGSSIINPNVRGTYGASWSGYPFQIGATSPTIISGANIYSDRWTSFWNLTGGYTPTLSASVWDAGTVPAQTSFDVATLTAGLMSTYGAAGTNRDTRWLTGTSPRWIARATNTAEGGSSAGSDWELIAYKDDGSFAFTPFRGIRASGLAVLNRGSVRTRATQTLAASGAVAIDAALSSHHRIQLQANATSTTVDNTSAIPTTKPTYNGQELTITWEQDATGGRTYAWPTICKFAGGSSPADTTANTRTSVTFIFEGSRWYELSRAVAVPLT